ncbi:MAG: fibronectin type III domain-containing protein [Flavobacteriales bacterium]|nr:fibronectin type III domain-containing protein [Flavobacteriales bacterium]
MSYAANHGSGISVGHKTFFHQPNSFAPVEFPDHRQDRCNNQRFAVTSLVPYKSYWFRIMALGIDKEGLPSDVVLGRPA